MERPVWAEIDLGAVTDNTRLVKDLVSPATRVMAVVKANAYGHGVARVAGACLAGGAHSLAVAIVAEGIQLRTNGFTAPILVLGYTSPDQARLLLENNLGQAVFSLDQGKALAKAAREFCRDKQADVHVKIDTGMGRVGFLEHQLAEIKALSALPNLKIQGVFTHLAMADEPDAAYTLGQLSLFRKLVTRLKEQGIEPGDVHVANSAGVVLYPESHFNLVRPGLILYGMYPSDHVQQEMNRRGIYLKPAMAFKTRVAFLKRVPRGTSISYGCTFQTKQDSLIATLPLGYADGYSRILSNYGQVLVRGRLAPVVGRVCMDQTMVDVSEIDRVSVGDEVVLFGTDSEGRQLPVEQVAQTAGTINYELACQVSYRVPRIYS